MQAEKLEVMEKMAQKKLSVEQVAEAIQFDPVVLGLYLARDDYPMPMRIIKKINETALN